MGNGVENKVVAISGAGKGLGRAYALYLAGLGARVVVNNRSHADEAVSSADAVVAEIRAAGGEAVAEYSSVEDPGSGERLLACALEHFGRLDAIVANAGISEGCSFHKQDLADFRRVININLIGTVNVVHPAFGHLYAQRSGSVVLSTSVAGLYGEHGLPAYSASKAALLGLMHSLVMEAGGHGVRVNALAPYAATPMTADDMSPALAERFRPGRVAPVLAWLLGEQCEVHGEILISGAGRLARARMMETGWHDLPAEDDFNRTALERSWQAVAASPLEWTYRSALEQFETFAATE